MLIRFNGGGFVAIRPAVPGSAGLLLPPMRLAQFWPTKIDVMINRRAGGLSFGSETSASYSVRFGHALAEGERNTKLIKLADLLR